MRRQGWRGAVADALTLGVLLAPTLVMIFVIHS